MDNVSEKNKNKLKHVYYHVMNQQHFPPQMHYNYVVLNLHYQREYTPPYALVALLELDFFNNFLYPFFFLLFSSDIK